MKPSGKRFILGWVVYGGGLLFIVLISTRLANNMPVLVLPAYIILFAWAIGELYGPDYIGQEILYSENNGLLEGLESAGEGNNE